MSTLGGARAGGRTDGEAAGATVWTTTDVAVALSILKSYKLHANAYVTKPVDFARFISVVRQIDEFFVSVVKLPRR